MLDSRANGCDDRTCVPTGARFFLSPLRKKRIHKFTHIDIEKTPVSTL